MQSLKLQDASVTRVAKRRINGLNGIRMYLPTATLAYNGNPVDGLDSIKVISGLFLHEVFHDFALVFGPYIKQP